MTMDWEKEDAHVVLKFQYGKRGSANQVVSRTMGRIAVISHAYQGKMPQPKSFWLCRIDKEFGNESSNGCYVVTPVKEVKLESIMKLVPGAYDTQICGTTVMCRPRVDDQFWIIPFSLKKYFIKKDKAEIQYKSIIVPLKFSP